MPPEAPSSAPIAFLFLGESLLIPHLLPIVEALARLAPDLPIDLWVRNPEIEAIIIDRISDKAKQLRVRRTPGFRSSTAGKLVVLMGLLPRLLATPVIICAEQTSLWLPTLLPFKWRFVKTSHGVGSMSARDDWRRRSAWRLLVPSELERDTYLRRGFHPEKVIATGYVKCAFVRETRLRLFENDRPILLYTPHWQRHRSSWWDWGPGIVAMLAHQRLFNVILAPHQRLIERDPNVANVLGGVAALAHVHVDLDSFAMVDGSYTAAADIYLGDTSSQVVEFLSRPRPCIFLNNTRIDWRATDDHGFWECGEVVEQFDRVAGALADASFLHPSYRPTQEKFASTALGDCSLEAPVRAAKVILEAIERHPSQDVTRRPPSVSIQA